MKRNSLIIFCLSLAMTMLAVPARRIQKTLHLNDGTQVLATLCGDEIQHWYTDSDGHCYMLNEDGIAHRINLQDEQIVAQQRRMAQQNVRQRRVKMGLESNPVSGKHSGIVILANFSDYKMTYTREDYERFFNEVGYSEQGMHGSVHDYFMASSYGQLDMSFDVVGPIMLKKSVTYYGSNDSRGDDRHPGAMISEAVKAADALGIDWKKYDWDGDGEVDQVFVIYAGYGEAQSGNPTDMWPHEGTLSAVGYYGDGTGALTLGGVTVDTYATSCELQGSEGTKIDGIGTACHEFSHCMGLPDTYDTNGNVNFAMDVWDVMDYGCYNGVGGIGNCPWEFTSYERMFCGWLTPVELKEGCEVRNMRPLNEVPEAYIIYNDGNRNEYYLLENRQLRGFDAGGYGHGMVVLHVDYDKTAWANNQLNTDASRQRMTIIPADNSQTSLAKGITYVAGDPFPGIMNKTQLTNTSKPTASLYNKNTDGQLLMNKPITNIAESDDGLISFTFMDGGTVIDGIQNVTAESSSILYDLSGRRVTTPHRGLYIRQGKKVVR